MGAELAAGLTRRYSGGPPESDRFLPARAVWERYGVTSMSLHRWIADPELAFPKPTYIGRFRYWRISELEEWEAKQPRSQKAEAA